MKHKGSFNINKDYKQARNFREFPILKLFSISRKNYSLVPPLLFPPVSPNQELKIQITHKKSNSRPNKSRFGHF